MEDDVSHLEHETRSSIVLKRSTKGERSTEIKVYFAAADDEAQADALARIEAIDKALRERYP